MLRIPDEGRRPLKRPASSTRRPKGRKAGPDAPGMFGNSADAFQPTISSGGFPVFVSKLNASGSALVYSTFLGGNQTEVGYRIAADASGNAYITGSTRSTNTAVTITASQGTINGAATLTVTHHQK